MRRRSIRRACGVVLAGATACELATDAWTKLRGGEPTPAAAATTVDPSEGPPSPGVPAVGPAAAPVEPLPTAGPALPWTTPTAEAAAFEVAAARVTAELLRRHVEAIASDETAGRATPSPGLDRAAELIATEFARLDLEAPSRAPEYLQRFECGAPGAAESSNVVGLLPGTDVALRERYVLVTAHYDHLGTVESAEAETDTIFNGANDDASGVAAMLAIAEVLAAVPDRPRRSVLFVAFCGEELGMRGSRHYVEDPVVPLGNTVAQLNLEMLGRPEQTTPMRAWSTGTTLSNLGEALARAGAEADVEFVDGAVIGRVEGNLFTRSDNYPLAQAGVVAHSISAGRLDEHYHRVDDEPALLEYDRMVPIVRALARAVWRLAQDEHEPRWSAQGTAAGYAAPRRPG